MGVLLTTCLKGSWLLSTKENRDILATSGIDSSMATKDDGVTNLTYSTNLFKLFKVLSRVLVYLNVSLYPNMFKIINRLLNNIYILH